MINEVAQNILWKAAIESELKSASEWETNWGFLKAPKKQLPHEFVEEGAEGPEGVRDEKEMDPRVRYRVNKMKTPKERFSKPTATSHDYGWRPNIELFGVAQHGLQKNPDLWPEK